MPQGAQFQLERRAAALAQAYRRRVDFMKSAIAPEGERRLWKTALPRTEALDFWRLHRYDEVGARILTKLKPQDIMQLDAALSEQIGQDRLIAGRNLGMG